MKYKIKGLDLFAQSFERFTNNYIIVGGTACYLVMQNVGLDFRSTKDIDVIITIEELSMEFGQQFWGFIKEGGYSIYQKNGECKFYRFIKPTNENYPAVIELFSRRQEMFDETINSTFTPIVIDDNVSSLSAILLDNNYYNFLKKGRDLINGVSILKPIYLIAFKAKAFIDLFNKKSNGENVDSKDIKKHRNDIFRLAQLLSGEEVVEDNLTIKNDIKTFFDIVDKEEIDLEQLGIIGINQKGITKILKDIFKI